MDEQLKQRLRQQLERLAFQRKTMSYRELAQLAEVPGPQVIRRLTEMLEAIIREDMAKGDQVSVAGLAVSQANPAIPRAGFFMLLRELGLYSGPDEGEQAAAFHADYICQVFSQFS